MDFHGSWRTGSGGKLYVPMFGRRSFTPRHDLRTLKAHSAHPPRPMGIQSVALHNRFFAHVRIQSSPPKATGLSNCSRNHRNCKNIAKQRWHLRVHSAYWRPSARLERPRPHADWVSMDAYANLDGFGMICGSDFTNITHTTERENTSDIRDEIAQDAPKEAGGRSGTLYNL